MTLFFLQLRKPLVEKIHRKRINSNSKLEKADILASCKDCSRSVNLWTQQLLRATQDVFKSCLNHINQLHISSEGNLSEADFSPLIVTAKDKSPVYSSLCWPW
uniref:Uncharacterized protein n=1 Tax=Pundamilia nyererei TaxID=303518 RepID=A0A3B4F0V1_9CICH